MCPRQLLPRSLLLLDLLDLPDHVIRLQVTRVARLRQLRHLLSLGPSMVALQLRSLPRPVSSWHVEELVQLLSCITDGEVRRCTCEVCGGLCPRVRLRLELTVIRKLIQSCPQLIVTRV